MAGNTISTKIQIEGEREYKSSIKNITQETKTLDAKLKEVASRFDDETEAMEKAQESTELLKKKKEALEEELGLMKDRLKDVSDAYGEDSTEALKLEEQIAKVETQLNTTNGALEQNEIVLNSVADASEETADAVGEIGDASAIADSIFGSSIGNMASAIVNFDIIGAISSVADAAAEIGKKAWDAWIEYQEAMGNIAVQTGMTGEELDSFMKGAENLWGSFDYAGLTIGECSDIVAALSTRFGIGEADIETFGTAVLEFAKVTGVDGVDAVNALADLMRQWGMETDNSLESFENLTSIMDMLVVAGENCDANLGTLTDVLTDQAGAAQALGLGMEDVLGYLVAFEDAGGNASTMGMALKTAFQNLNKEIESNEQTTMTAKDAWNEIIEVLQNAETMDQALNTEIGDLGITMNDVFGNRTAQMVAQTFTVGKANVDVFTAAISNSRGEIQMLIGEIYTAADAMSSLGKSIVMNSTGGIKNPSVLNYGNASNGDMAFAKAMYKPYEFHGEQTITVGEAGPEVLVGKGYFDNLVTNANGGGNNTAIVSMLSQYLPYLAKDQNIYIDSERVAKATKDALIDEMNWSEKVNGMLRG